MVVHVQRTTVQLVLVGGDGMPKSMVEAIWQTMWRVSDDDSDGWISKMVLSA